MGRVAISALLASLIALPALASVADIDMDGDGKANLDEVSAVYLDVNAENFAVLDTNSDGFLDDAELTAALEAGTLVEAAE